MKFTREDFAEMVEIISKTRAEVITDRVVKDGPKCGASKQDGFSKLSASLD